MANVKRLFSIDIGLYEKAIEELNIYHDMLLHNHAAAIQEKASEEEIDSILMQADIVHEILIKLKTSVVNGANFNPGGDTTIH